MMCDERRRRRRVFGLVFVSAALSIAFASCQDGRREGGGGGDGGGTMTSAGDSHATTTTAAAPMAAAAAAGAAPTTMPAVAEAAGDVSSFSTSAKARLAAYAYPPAPSAEADKARKEAAAAAGVEDLLKHMNRACVACHTDSDDHDMHATAVGAALACVDCHGGNWDTDPPADFAADHQKYDEFKRATHVQPRLPWLWRSAANPEVAGGAALRESVDYIRFVNPGDLRAAYAACGACHNSEKDGFLIDRVQTSMMTHGAMLWSAALYNNGTLDSKNPVYGEMYVEGDPPTRVGHYAHERSVLDPAEEGGEGEGEAAPQGPEAIPARIVKSTPERPVTVGQFMYQGILPQLWPMYRWEISQPGNVLRVFERGGRLRPVIGQPFPPGPSGSQGGLDDPGRPDVKLSLRGIGTDVRTDPVTIGLQKTRLFDPTLNMMGTNDQPGDYRASGCSACHVVYANDRSPVHSAKWAGYGNRGESFSKDPTVNPQKVTAPTTQPFDRAGPVREPGHPIQHTFVRAMPTTTCIVCHVHPGTNVSNSYLGFMWWDNESDAKFMYPKDQKYPTADDFYTVHQHNPEGAATRGLWSDLYPTSENHVGQVAGPNFLANLGTPRFNGQLERVHFADFHGHGWVFRAVYKLDKHGHMLDHRGFPVEDVNAAKMAEGVEFTRANQNDKPKDGVPVHLKDIHLEMGMHCADCHFDIDNHGDGNLYGETRNATMINCEDCHGTMEEPSKLAQYVRLNKDWRNDVQAKKLLGEAFTGNAAPKNPTDTDLDRLAALVKAHFDRDLRTRALTQKGAVDPSKRWFVVQTSDTLNPDWRPDSAGRRTGEPDEAEKKRDEERAVMARFAHTVRRDGKHWGGDPSKDQTGPAMELAHGSNSMSCYACHTSWNTSCFGCHLPQRANQRRDMLHYDGEKTRNYTNYNYQTLRDDVYMLGVDSTVKKHKVVPIRSACAVMVSSQDALRQWIYTQQQTVSAEGFAGTAFSPYFPHTVRSTETKQCTDCHVSKENDNNATMAQLLLQGTNAVNFVGRFAWVAAGKGGLEAVAVAEREEPQAVIGSTLHKWAYPDYYRQHQERGQELKTAHDHHGTVLDVQLRGEYLYAACGPDGFIAYDVANVENKGFSERIITAPVSPLGQRFYVKSKYATSITSPSTLAIDPTRPRKKLEVPQPDGSTYTFYPNEEGKITKLGDPKAVIEESRPIHLMYAFLYLTDAQEGLIVIGNPLTDKKNKPGVATLLDGDPDNNFLQRALTWNPDGLLKGARSMAFHGHYAYIVCDAGVVVADFDNPLEPRVVTTLTQFNGPRKIQFQFRYGFVLDNEGLHVIDVTFPDRPQVTGARLPIADARDIYVSRTLGYVAAGREGLVIVDLEKPLEPTRYMTYDAEGRMNDANAVRVGMTNSSLYAYVADGVNGLKVIQLTSPDDNPTYMGFSPRPKPQLIAWRHTDGPALAISEGLDRDRAVDEAGQQLSVFGRRGARPFTLEEQQRLYLRTNADGSRQVYTVSNLPEGADYADLGSPASATGQPAQGTQGTRPGGLRRPGAGTPAPGGPPRPGGLRRPGGASSGSSEDTTTEQPAAAPADQDGTPEATPPRPGGLRRPGLPRPGAATPAESTEAPAPPPSDAAAPAQPAPADAAAQPAAPAEQPPAEQPAAPRRGLPRPGQPRTADDANK